MTFTDSSLLAVDRVTIFVFQDTPHMAAYTEVDNVKPKEETCAGPFDGKAFILCFFNQSVEEFRIYVKIQTAVCL